MQQRETLVRKLQSATTSLAAIQEKYQDKAAPLELVPLLQVVMGMLQENRREILLQELTTVLHNEAIPAATRKEKVVKIFQSLA
jgi:hypothetical protein